ANGRAAAPRGKDPRSDVRVVVERGDDYLVTRAPCRGESISHMECKRGHVWSEHHAVRFAADQIGYRATSGGDGLRAPRAGLELAVDVGHRKPHSLGDRFDHSGRGQRARGAVERDAVAGEARELPPDLLERPGEGGSAVGVSTSSTASA